MELVQDDVNVYCKSTLDPHKTAYENLINPFDCATNDPQKISRSKKGVYRPCYNEDWGIQVEIEHYSIGRDLSNATTLEHCFKKWTNHPRLMLNHTTLEQPFPVIGSLDDEIYAPAGYLQCSQNDIPSSNMLTSLWITVYSIYAFGFIYLLLFGFLKYVKEATQVSDKSMNSVNSTDLSDSSSEVFESANFINQNNIRQKGYLRTIYGEIAFSILAIMSIGLALLMIVMILDVYGMNYHTFCKNDPVTQEACRIPIETGVDPNWRLGYSCAAGCVFSYAKTKGIDPDWPFFTIPGGEAKIQVAFIIVWHITLVWWLLLKLYSKNIQSFFYIRCELSKATYVLISKPIEDEIITESESSSLIRRCSKVLHRFLEKIRGKQHHHKFCRVNSENDIRFFDFQCLRYCWNESSRQFQISQFLITGTQEEIITYNKHGLTELSAANRLMALGANSLDIEIPSIHQAIFSEFFDYLYLYQFFTLLIWNYSNYWTVALVTSFIILLSASIKIINKRKSQFKVKKMTHKGLSIWVLRSGQWQYLPSTYLVPGDLIKLTECCQIPCDGVLIDGRCVLDESTLTGEPTPVPKIALSSTSEQKYEISQANMKYTLFSGSFLQSFSNGKSGSTLMVVTATGASTNKGKLMKDLLFPPPFSFTFEQHLNVVYILLLVWSCVVMGFVIYFLNATLSSWFLSIFITSQIFTPLIPAVYVAALSQGSIHLSKKNVFCVNINRMAVAGKIKIFCFDKTGTLTKSGLRFKGIQHNSVAFTGFKFLSPHDQYPDHVKMLCGCCNELDFITSPEGEMSIVGNEIDEALFSASKFSIKDTKFSTIVQLGDTSLRILRRFEFDRATMSMSVIVEDQNDVKFVFTKGSYETISRMVRPDTLPVDYFSKADSLAKEGVYMLGMAFKPFDSSYDISEIKRDIVESDLCCLGLIMFENPLKECTPNVIEELKEGNIATRILTGDNSLTASYIARTSSISTSKNIILGDLDSNEPDMVTWKDFDSGLACDDILSNMDSMKAGITELAITGRAFIHLANADSKHSIVDAHSESRQLDPDGLLKQILPYIRIFSRLTPDQKVTIIAEQMQLGLTGMCGDGANDLGALRLAHCGIAISSGSTEAGLVSHFSSPDESLEVVLHVLKEGRSTLAKALSGFKALITFGETKALLGLMQYYFSVAAAEWYWISWDSLIYLGMSWCLLQSKATKHLHGSRPTSKSLGFETIFSISSIILINWIFMIGAIVMLFTKDWFLCNEYEARNVDQLKWYLKGDNYEAQVLSILTTFQLISAGPAYNFGFKYRSAWWKNHSMTIFTLLVLGFYSYIFLSGPSFLSCLFRTNCGDKSLLNKWIEIGHDRLISSRVPANAPPGCPCSQQFAVGDGTCQVEYLNCMNDHYQSPFHHNIMPRQDLIAYYFYGLSNMTLVILWEAFVVLGPGRKLFYNFKHKLSK